MCFNTYSWLPVCVCRVGGGGGSRPIPLHVLTALLLSAVVLPFNSLFSSFTRLRSQEPPMTRAHECRSWNVDKKGELVCKPDASENSWENGCMCVQVLERGQEGGAHLQARRLRKLM